MALATTHTDTVAYRVGYAPDPWTWTPWEFAPFNGRWDDADDLYRVLYAGDSPIACLLEVLAQFRPDPGLPAEDAAIEGDPDDDDFPAAPLGTLDRSWLDRRRLGTARMAGTFVVISHSETIAELRRRFLPLARRLSLPDVDAAALRLHSPREFTHRISAYVYGAALEGGGHADGIAFESRHGDDLRLWAIYERSADFGLARSHLLRDFSTHELDEHNPSLEEALRLHGLRMR
ncbi:MAG: hypothetical protein NVSMB4_17040 [Acidimicrobiales bacterium]